MWLPPGTYRKSRAAKSFRLRRQVCLANAPSIVHSMGGYGASRIGMKHADVFGSRTRVHGYSIGAEQWT